ncbi:sensor histidine kinase [Blastococcus jejuensis]|uniref:sensor histidine kinase n=1 Tax=Blastococcus jejuensis TaxID=351224 RepID=UPI0031CE6629
MVPERLRGAAGEDVLVALALALAVQAEVWIWWVEDEQGTRSLAAVLGLAMTVPMVWRRRRPLPALTAVAAVYVTWTLLTPPRGSLAPYLVVLVAVYSAAAHGSARSSWAGLGLGVAAEVLFVARTTNDLADYAFILAFLVGAWLAGRGMRVRQQRADAHFARAVRAEVDREEKARAAVAEERGRIARELHDIISHSVSVMVVQAGAAEQVLDRDPDQVRESLQAIQRTGRDARLELRRLLGVLRTGDGERPEYGPQPGLAQLAQLADQLRSSGVDLAVDVEGPPRPLPAGVDLTAYRIAQEAVTNALKHAAGARVTVRIRYGRDDLDVEVLDDGGPGPGGDGGGGFGLGGMRERAALYGGELEHGRRPEGGYRVHARLPLTAVEA